MLMIQQSHCLYRPCKGLHFNNTTQSSAPDVFSPQHHAGRDSYFALESECLQNSGELSLPLHAFALKSQSFKQKKSSSVLQDPLWILKMKLMQMGIRGMRQNKSSLRKYFSQSRCVQMLTLELGNFNPFHQSLIFHIEISCSFLTEAAVNNAGMKPVNIYKRVRKKITDDKLEMNEINGNYRMLKYRSENREKVKEQHKQGRICYVTLTQDFFVVPCVAYYLLFFFFFCFCPISSSHTRRANNKPAKLIANTDTHTYKHTGTGANILAPSWHEYSTLLLIQSKLSLEAVFQSNQKKGLAGRREPLSLGLDDETGTMRMPSVLAYVLFFFFFLFF